MKKFIIHVNTNWCGMDADYAAYAKQESDLEELANELAYNNYESYGLDTDVAETNGYDLEKMTNEDWDRLWEEVNQSDYYSYSIEEFTGDDDEWKDYELVTNELGECQ